jgi:uncharacterized membrane protein
VTETLLPTTVDSRELKTHRLVRQTHRRTQGKMSRKVSLTSYVAAGAALQAMTVSILAILQHRAFGSWGFDLGIYDQTWWLMGQDGVSTESFSTVRGLAIWGHHVNAIMVPLAPFARLGFGPQFLMIVQAFTLAVGALPIAWLARSKSGSTRIGAVCAAVYLLYPAVSWLGWVSFHPEALAVSPLLFALWFAHSRQRLRLAASIVVALSCREEIGLVVFGLGISWVLGAAWAEFLVRRTHRNGKSPAERPRWNRGDVFVGLATSFVGLSWFFVCSKWIIPSVLGGEAFYVQHFYARYGSSMGEVLTHLATHPGTTIGLTTEPQARTYLLDLFAPLGGIPLLGAPLISALPQLVATLAADSKFIRDVRFQYTALMIPGLMGALVNVVSATWRRRPRLGRLLVGWLVLCTVCGALLRSPLPMGLGFQSWKLSNPAQSALEQAVAMVPDDAGVAAADNITPHLSHRRHAYDFPNPFEWMIYGKSEADIPNPANADWIVLQPATLSKNHRAIFDSLVKSQTFRVVYRQDGVVVAQRSLVRNN